MKDILIGVDAGGTKTVAAAYTPDGTLIATQSGAAGNVAADPGTASRAIIDTIKALLTHIEGLFSASLPLLCVGAAGVSRGGEILTRALDSAFEGRFDRICVISDAELALHATHGGEDGLLLIAGTGSIGYRKSGSTLYRAGGWGHLLGDEGSAWAIARAAICTVLQATDRGLPAPEPLWHAIAAQLQIGTPQALLSYVYSHPKADVAALCRAVTQCADGGDPLALRILQQAGEALADLAQELVSRAPCQEKLPLAISGSVLRHCTHVRTALERAASEKKLPLSHIISADEPTRGVLAFYRNMTNGGLLL